MSFRLTANHITVAIAIAGLVFWIIALAGVGATHAKCNDLNSHNNYIMSTSTYLGVDCGKIMQHPWWTVWFNFFLLIAVIVLGIIDRLATHRFSLLALIAVCTSLTMDCTEMFMNSPLSSSATKSQQDAGAAGMALLSIINLLLLISLGSFVGNTAANTEVHNANAEVQIKQHTPQLGAPGAAVDMPPSVSMQMGPPAGMDAPPPMMQQGPAPGMYMSQTNPQAVPSYTSYASSQQI